MSVIHQSADREVTQKMSRLRMRRPKYMGEKIKSIRENWFEGYLRQDQIADLLRATLTTEFSEDYPQLNREYVSGFERGIRILPPVVLLAYAHLANVYVDVIIDDRLDFSTAGIPVFPFKEKSAGVFKTTKK